MTHTAGYYNDYSCCESINQSIDLYCITKNIVTQWVQAKLDKLVTSLSQLLINYYRVKMNVHQTD